MVHRDQFNQSLMQVNLVDPPQPQGAEAAGALPKSSHSSTKYAQVSTDNYQSDALSVNFGEVRGNHRVLVSTFVISKKPNLGLLRFHQNNFVRCPEKRNQLWNVLLMTVRLEIELVFVRVSAEFRRVAV